MKKLFAALLACMLICAPAQAASNLFVLERQLGGEADAVSVLVNTETGLAVPGGAYGNLYMVSNMNCPADRRLYAACSDYEDPGFLLWGEEGPDNRYALMNGEGEKLTEEVFSRFIHDWENGAVLARKGETWGVLDENGNVILDFEYCGVAADGEGGFFVLPEAMAERNSDGDILGCPLCHIDAAGTRIISKNMVHGGLMPMNSGTGTTGVVGDGLLGVQIGDSELCSYVNTRCEVVLKDIAKTMNRFENGVCAATVDKIHYGILRIDGTWAMEPLYMGFDYDWRVGRSFAAVRDGNMCVISRETYEELATFPHRDDNCVYNVTISPSVLQISLGDETSLLVNMDGGVICPMDAEQRYTWETNNAQVAGEANRIIRSERSSSGYGGAYLIDLSCKEVAGPFNDIGVAWWRDGAGRFLVSTGGKMTWEIQATTPEGEHVTYTLEADEVKAGVQDADGNEIVQASGEMRGGKYGVIDQDGAEVIPLIYDDLSYLGDGVYWARQGDQWGLLTEDGTWKAVCDEKGEALS